MRRCYDIMSMFCRSSWEILSRVYEVIIQDICLNNKKVMAMGSYVLTKLWWCVVRMKLVVWIWLINNFLSMECKEQRKFYDKIYIYVSWYRAYSMSNLRSCFYYRFSDSTKINRQCSNIQSGPDFCLYMNIGKRWKIAK